MAAPKTLQPKAPASTQAEWWRSGVIYQIYVRSFYDTNHDGIGNINGVTEKLDYLAGLGVSGIWLSPVTKSANVDWGYDVTDYYGIEPSLGTLEDFDNLIAEAERRNIKVLMDIVPNHTSTEHPWFQNALTGRHAEYRDYYLWADPKPDGQPPSNWRSYGGGSAWEYHKSTGQYYLHNFFKGQADLNWRNEAVRAEFDKIMKFWLDRGVAGFRIDVFNMLIKDAHYRDNPKSNHDDGPEIRIMGQRATFNISQPEVHEVLKRWRSITDSYEPRGLLLGESTLVYNMDDLAAYYGTHDELELALNLKFVDANFTAPELRSVITEVESAIKSPDWPVWAGSNHDKPRFPSRWGDGDERKIRCGLLMMIALRGTPILYYGDEIGLLDVFVAPWRLKDPRGRKNWPIDGGRDRSRNPMPWSNQVGAGFTPQGTRPWLPYGDLKVRSVQMQEKLADSTLQFTKDLIGMRSRVQELATGDYTVLETPENVWAWKRGSFTTVAINYSNKPQQLKDMVGRIALSTVRDHEGLSVNGLLELDPWEGIILQPVE